MGGQIAVLAILLHAGAASSIAPAARIMPLGDSITQWVCGPLKPSDRCADTVGFGGYRTPLGKSLHNKNVAFDFVGFQYDCGSHAGISGHTCKEISQEIAANAGAHQPTHVMLMCGTNDFYFRNSTLDPSRGGNVTEVIGRMNDILTNLWSVTPDAHVFLSTVTHINATRCADYPPGACPPDMASNIAEFNSLLPSKVVAPAVARGKKIHLHDVNVDAEWVEEDYYTHGIHFSLKGFDKMAVSWEKALMTSFDDQPQHQEHSV